MKIPRALLLLMLVVLTQACAAAGVNSKAVAVDAPRPARVARVTELSGCSGERFGIDLLDAIEKIPEDTLDAQREQLRDWVFMVTLARVAQRTSAEDVLTGVAGELLVRDDALTRVIDAQSGPTRSTSTKSGGVIVLVQADAAPLVAAEVAEAIDKEALHAGGTPSDAQVFQYLIRPEVARADVCAMKPLSKDEIESAARGYRSATIATEADLEKFLAGGVDLLSAQCTEAGLEVKGRKTPRAARAPITVEHIAALSQARGTGFVPPERFGASLEKESASNRAVLEANGRLVDGLKGPLAIQSEDVQIVASWKKKNPKIPTALIWLSYELQKETVGRPGFSLDPHTNPAHAVKLLDDVIAALPDVQKIAAIFRGMKVPETAEWLVEMAAETNEPFAAEAKGVLVATRDKLKKAQPDEAKALLYPELPRSFGNDVATQLLQSVAIHSSQQCARYDGPLLGTETGMTFFYTDLLAKIWNFDLNGAAPEGPVEGFRSSIHGASSTATCNEASNKSTRMWLGVREEGFSREASGLVRFQPVATRIFAKSSNLGASEKEEFEATAESKRFVDWWDQHYAAIAAWEPQYELLNQIMKWSVAVQQATLQGKSECFAPLDKVAVRADRRIDKWIAETQGLRWRGPVKLLRGKDGAENKPGDPECMNLFRTELFESCGGVHSFSGGVSAASLAQVNAKVVRPASLSAPLGRLGAAEAPVAAGPGRLQFKAIAKSAGTLENVSVESVAARTRFSAEMKTAEAQVGVSTAWDKAAPLKSVEKSVEIRGKQVVALERKNGLVNAELKTSDLDAANINLKVRPASLLEGKAEAQKVASKMHLDGVDFATASASVARRPGALVGKDRVAWPIEVEGGKKWMVMESGAGNRGPPSGVDARFTVGVPGASAHRAGSSEISRSPMIRVTVQPKPPEGLSPSLKAANDTTLASVQEKIANNDIPGALKVVSAEPYSADAHASVLEHALKSGDTTSAGRVVDSAIKNSRAPTALRELGKNLETARVLAAREGLDTSFHEAQQMRLAIAEGRLSTPGRLGVAQKGARAAEPALYAPTNYSIGAELPPAVHPPGKRLMPDEKYVTRVLPEANPSKLAGELEVNGVKYTQRAPGQEVALEYGEVGSPWRLLLGSTRPIKVVVRCDDRDSSLPPCHERPSPEQIEQYEAAMKCDGNGDASFDTAEERACLDALKKSWTKPNETKEAP